MSIMRKEYLFIMILIILIAAVVGGFVGLLKKTPKVSEAKMVNEIQNVSQNENAVTTASSEEKVSPNTTFALKKYYDECSHFDYEEAEIPYELVNLTQEEVEEYYADWKVEKFAKNELVLTKEINGYCNQHFLIKLDNDLVNIYRVGTLGELNQYQSTDIAKDYLPEEDIGKLEEGIPVFGEGKLSAILEDYE